MIYCVTAKSSLHHPACYGCARSSRSPGGDTHGFADGIVTHVVMSLSTGIYPMQAQQRQQQKPRKTVRSHIRGVCSSQQGHKHRQREISIYVYTLTPHSSRFFCGWSVCLGSEDFWRTMSCVVFIELNKHRSARQDRWAVVSICWILYYAGLWLGSFLYYVFLLYSAYKPSWC